VVLPAFASVPGESSSISPAPVDTRRTFILFS
jgi:hypothetical protein